MVAAGDAAETNDDPAPLIVMEISVGFCRSRWWPRLCSGLVPVVQQGSPSALVAFG